MVACCAAVWIQSARWRVGGSGPRLFLHRSLHDLISMTLMKGSGLLEEVDGLSGLLLQKKGEKLAVFRLKKAWRQLINKMNEFIVWGPGEISRFKNNKFCMRWLPKLVIKTNTVFCNPCIHKPGSCWTYLHFATLAGEILEEDGQSKIPVNNLGVALWWKVGIWPLSVQEVVHLVMHFTILHIQEGFRGYIHIRQSQKECSYCSGLNS